MFEPKLVKSRTTLPLDARKAIAAMIQSKLASVEVNWTSGRGDILIGGHVFCSITREGALALKLAPERMNELIGNGQAKPWQFGNRTLENWMVISATDDPAWALERLREAKAYVRTLPAEAKPPKRSPK